MNDSTKIQVTLMAGLLSIPVVGIPIGCAVEDTEEIEELEEIENSQEDRSDPGKGTGSASWTIVSGRNTLVFSASITDGVAAEPVLIGTPPPFSALPMSVTNSDGETLDIEEVTIGGRSFRKYSGTYDIIANAAESAADCTECACAFGGGPPCSSALSWTDCSYTTGSCSTWSCSSGGGGVVTLELDITAVPGGW